MARRHKCPEFENHERWLVSYADMLTLLFAVFVVLFALKEGGESRHHKTAGSMQESFNMPLEDIPPDRQIGKSEQGFGIFQHFRGDRSRPTLVKKFPATEKKKLFITSEMKKLEQELEERLFGPNAHPTPAAIGSSRIVSIVRDEKGFRLNLTGRHFYDSGEVKFKEKSKREIDIIVSSLKRLGRKITIEGHTDSIPPRGKMDNWELSTMRAAYFVRYILEKHAYPQSLVSAAGYADTRPIAHNGSEEGRSLNRRIEIHVEYDDLGPVER